jgi:predicted branched-subunit amino acid permease
MNFKKGVEDGLPIGLGYFAVSFSFGIAGSKLLSSVLVTLISMTNLTSAGQFAGLQIMSEATGTLIEMAIATFFINLRYSLMAVSLSQKVSSSFLKIPFHDISIVYTVNLAERITSHSWRTTVWYPPSTSAPCSRVY